MNTSTRLGTYRQVQINTASRGKLILMLYQGAIQSLKKSVDMLDRKDYGGKGACIIKAQDIVMELNMSLDMRVGDISSSLRRLYFYIYRRLIDANLNLDRAAVQECIDILQGLHDAWELAVQKTEDPPQGEVGVSRLSIMG